MSKCAFFIKIFIGAELLQKLQQFDGSSKNSVLIMDNLIVHHCEPIISLLKDMGIVIQFLPPYSPDLNPIKEAFSYVKYCLNLHEDLMQVTNDPILLITSAIDSITVNMCNKWITDSG